MTTCLPCSDDDVLCCCRRRGSDAGQRPGAADGPHRVPRHLGHAGGADRGHGGNSQPLFGGGCLIASSGDRLSLPAAPVFPPVSIALQPLASLSSLSLDPVLHASARRSLLPPDSAAPFPCFLPPPSPPSSFALSMPTTLQLGNELGKPASPAVSFAAVAAGPLPPPLQPPPPHPAPVPPVCCEP